MAVRLDGAKFYAWDSNGDPLEGGKLYTYEAGDDTTPKPTYTGEDTGIANTNPVILNASGYADVYLDGSYNLVLYDQNDVLVWSKDPVSSNNLSEWIGCGEATYVSSTSFSVPGNKTDVYTEGRKVRMFDGTDYAYSTVISSSYSAPDTVIQLNSISVDAGITQACYAITTSQSSPDIANEWVDCNIFTRINSRTFSLEGNQVGLYEKYRSIRVNDPNLGFLYSYITRSTFAAGVTEIEVADLVITNNANQVCRSIVGDKSVIKQRFPTVDAMKAERIHADSTVFTNCWREPIPPAANKGGGQYQVYTPENYTLLTGNASPDGYADHKLANNNVAKLLTGQVTEMDCFGVFGNGTTDDTASIQAAQSYMDKNGGTLNITQATYLVSDNVGNGSAGATKILIEANGAVFKLAPRTTQYTMFSLRQNMTIRGLNLEGYVASGTGWADAVPQSGFGFRSSSNSGTNISLINCSSNGMSYDGWYIDNEFSQIDLLNCSGKNNYRNDFAMVNGIAARIFGGVWGDDDQVLNKVESIDIETNPGQMVKSVIIRDLKCHYTINFNADNGSIQSGLIDGVLFDGDIYGDEAGLIATRSDVLTVGSIDYINGAKLHRLNVGLSGGQKKGAIYSTNASYKGEGPNLIVNNYNSSNGWTQSSSGSPVITQNVDLGNGLKGVNLNNNSSGFLVYRQAEIPCVAGEYYTFGGYVNLQASTSSQQGLYVQLSNGVTFYLVPVNLNSAEYINAVFQVPDGVNSMTFGFGTGSSSNFIGTFTNVFLAKGILVSQPDVNRQLRQAAAPTTGAWKIGDRVYNSEPSVDGSGFVLNHWLCTEGGTPGTWVGQFITT